VSAHSDITVVIPCFNAGSFVREAVESALSQQGGAPQVVVVDDGSTDVSTVEELERLAIRVRVIRQGNRGPAAARNTGAEHVRTPLLLMLDADDRLDVQALDRLRPPLEGNSSLGFSYGLAQFFGEWSAVLRFPDYDPYRLLYRSIVPATSLLRLAVFEEVGGYDPEMRGAYEDWDFYLAALERGWRGQRVPEVVFHYRRAGASGIDASRAIYRTVYRTLRLKHPQLYEHAAELARETDLGPLGRLAYRTLWARRPVPARVERALYTRIFR
jgi:glycosyltransferase involved in cell wall biosynthesis